MAFTWVFFTDNGYPLWGFLSGEVGRFDDFWGLRNEVEREFYKGNEYYTIYPLSVPIYIFFGLFEYRVSLLVWFFIPLFIIILLFFKLNIGWKYFLLFLTLYPTYFTISRGNNEIYLFCALLFFVYFNFKDKVKLSFISLLIMQFIELAPFYFLLSRAKLRIMLSFSLLLILIISIVFIERYGFQNYITYIQSLFMSGKNYSGDRIPGSSLHSISLSGSIQVIDFLISDNWPNSNTIYFSYLNPTLLIFGITLTILFSLNQKVFLIDKLLITTLSWALFRAISYDYAQIFLIIPLFMILSDVNSCTKIFLKSSDLKRIRKYYSISVLLLLAFIPKPYIWFNSVENSLGGTLGTLINPLIYLIVIIITIRMNKNNFRLINYRILI